MAMSTDRKKEIIKHLGKDYFMFNLYDDVSSKDKMISEIDETLKKHGIGKISDPFVFTEREYVCLFKYISEEEYLKRGYERFILSYKIEGFNKENYEKNANLYIFDDSFLLDCEDILSELSDSYNPKIDDIEMLLGKYKQIQFGRLNDKTLEWLILSENDNQVILLSKYLVEDNSIMKYQEDWEMEGYLLTTKEFETQFNETNIFKYLNTSFKNFFDDDEINKIIDITIPEVDDIEEYLNTDYLNLCEPCLSDFGRTGIYKKSIYPYIVRSNDSYLLIEINGELEYPIPFSDDLAIIGIRPMITIRK